MPKVRSHSASKKRFRKNGNGKIKRAKAYRRHHAWAKTPKQIRSLRSGAYLSAADEKGIATLIPY